MRTWRIIPRLACLGLLITATSAIWSADAGAASGPRWVLEALSNTTVEPGSEFTYRVNVRNLGDQPSSGPRSLLATLPSGVTALSAKVTRGEALLYQCSSMGGGPVAGATQIVCETERELEQRIRPELLTLTVAVDSAVASELVAKFEITGGGGGAASTVDATRVSGDPEFGIDAFDIRAQRAGGSTFTQAGGHPDEISTYIDFNTAFNPNPAKADVWPVASSRDIFVDLPPGLLGTTAGLERCQLSDLANSDGARPMPLCLPETQVGTALVRVRFANGRLAYGPSPVFNIVPPVGAPARFGFNVAGTVVVLDAGLRSDGNYGLTVGSRNTVQGLPTVGAEVSFWGVPADEVHRPERNCPGNLPPAIEQDPSCASTASATPFLRWPTSCTDGGLPASVHTDSWVEPGEFEISGFPDLSDPRWRSASLLTHEQPGYPYPPALWGEQAGLSGCGEVPFTPEIDVAPTTDRADSPTGLDVDLRVGQDCWGPGQVESICQSDLRGAEVALPKGMTLNPSSASGLEACTPAQAGLTTPVGQSDPIHFDGLPAHCPDAAKIGSVSIDTPLLGSNESPAEEDLEGSLYLASQAENPFGSLLSMYLVAEGSGVVIKQAGEIEVGAEGRLTTRFTDAPQLPFTSLHLDLFAGARAALRTPATCGTYVSDATLDPWSGNGATDLTSSFQIAKGPNGPCPSGAFEPTFNAGTANPLGGSYSPLNVRLTRPDASAELGGLDFRLPPGLLARLAGVGLCPDSALASLPREGTEPALGSGEGEIARPSCPASSLIGHLTVGAGSGPTPFFTDAARAYLAGPYKGAPYSVAVIAPAVAGPLDLGSVLVRNALTIDPVTSTASVASDPLPSAIHAIPLDLRDVRVAVDRPDFTLNPTSCNEMAIAADITSLVGAHAARSERFQAAGCDRLGFKPQLALRLKGATRRTDNPSLIATLKIPEMECVGPPAATKGDRKRKELFRDKVCHQAPPSANIAKAQVTLPKAAFLDNSHIKTVCTRVQFAANACPADSIYGKASATTPLLDYPLAGPVYLRSSSNELPDLVADLHGGPGLQIELSGITDSVKKGPSKGSLRNSFASVPDAPVSSFRLQLFGGKRGLVELSRNVCAHTYRARVLLDAQNGKTFDTEPVVKADCAGKPRKADKHRSAHR